MTLVVPHTLWYHILSRLLIAFALWGFTLSANTETPDPRRLVTDRSPEWLGAIGQLTVPGSRLINGYPRHHTENCSATLIHPAADVGTFTRAGNADLVLTAWHCLEFYRDLSATITFVLPQVGRPPITRTARPLQHGKSMRADWALLRLNSAISNRSAPALALSREKASPTRSLIMAGFSRDQELGQGGTRLTYDPDCRISPPVGGQGKAPSASIQYTDCRAYKGASGGPVIQYDSDGKARVYGVISEGNGTDISTYVPTVQFWKAIQPSF